LPPELLVRLVRGVFQREDRRRVIWLATSLLDAQTYPAQELLSLYGRRWRTETLLETLKLRLSADVLRSTRLQGIY